MGKAAELKTVINHNLSVTARKMYNYILEAKRGK
jgi:hypothetical protein